MPFVKADCDESTEECIEAFDELILSLQHHPPQVLAQAMGTHLEALLRALLARGECCSRDVREFLREIARGALF